MKNREFEESPGNSGDSWNPIGTGKNLIFKIFGSKEMYPTIYEKAAAYLYHLAKNRPFNDGNKRTAYVTALTFLKLNRAPLKFEIADLEPVVIG